MFFLTQLKQEQKSPARNNPVEEKETKLFDEKPQFIPGTQIPLPFQLQQKKQSPNYSQSTFGSREYSFVLCFFFYVIIYRNLDNSNY